MLAAKRSSCVAPEMDLRECTLNLPLQKKVNKAEPTMALKPRGDITRNPKQLCQWPHKRTMVHQKHENRSVAYFLKKRKGKNLSM